MSVRTYDTPGFTRPPPDWPCERSQRSLFCQSAKLPSITSYLPPTNQAHTERVTAASHPRTAAAPAVSAGGRDRPPGEPAGESSLTSLDPDETSVGFRPPTFKEDDTSPSRTYEESSTYRHATANQNFRHSFWKVRRAATSRAFTSALIPDTRRQRFYMCGQVAWLLRAKDNPDLYRVGSNRCRDRWCEACAVERRRTITQNIAVKLADKTLRLMTLTLKANDDGLRASLIRLIRGFRRMRGERFFRETQAGGMYFVEVTLNVKTRQWHPHLHVLIEGKFLPHEQIKQSWLAITGDSFVVDIRKTPNSKVAASYVAKYASKAVSSNVWQDPNRFDEAIIAIAGQRTFQTFGSWTRLHLSRPPADDHEWEQVCELWRVLELDRIGDPWAHDIIRRLTRNTPLETKDLTVPEPIDTG